MDSATPQDTVHLASVVIRTYNESKHLARLLDAIRRQETGDLTVEVVVVDSGSTDATLAIARSRGCRITEIRKEDFSFGRSLNIGCEFARGDFLVFVSGHCIPASDRWLAELVAPLRERKAAYSYGRQVGAETTKFSETQLFAKYFPDHSMIPQDGFFCNNANAALTRAAWSRFRFDETLTGLEDMDLAKKLVDDGQHIAYVTEAPVHHIHDETWSQVRHRYEREAIAMQKIAPNLHVDLVDCVRFFASGVLFDFSTALNKGAFLGSIGSIVAFRLSQYRGTYLGNRHHRKLSQKMKLRYYYPTSAHHPKTTTPSDDTPRRTSAI